jgi:hypothetical protein
MFQKYTLVHVCPTMEKCTLQKVFPLFFGDTLSSLNPNTQPVGDGMIAKGV